MRRSDLLHLRTLVMLSVTALHLHATPAYALSSLPDTSDASPRATPTSVGAPGGVVIVVGNAARARIESGVNIATLGEHGLALPDAGGEIITFPDVASVDYTGMPSQALITRDDDTRAVVDLSTRDVLFELPEFQRWGQDFGRWYIVPSDDTLTDWIIADVVTGDTRLLSEIVELPGDESVVPILPAVNSLVGDTQVFEVQPGRLENPGWNPSGPPVATFVIGGSLDRVVELADYPTVLDRVGSPVMVATDDGYRIAYETRAGDSRVIVLDPTTDRVLARYSAAEVSDDPILAGFTADGQVVVGTDTRILALDPGSGVAAVIADDLDNVDTPLVQASSGTIYVRQGDALLQVDAATGEVTGVTSGLAPGRFAFTKAGSDWITF